MNVPRESTCSFSLGAVAPVFCWSRASDTGFPNRAHPPPKCHLPAYGGNPDRLRRLYRMCPWPRASDRDELRDNTSPSQNVDLHVPSQGHACACFVNSDRNRNRDVGYGFVSFKEQTFLKALPFSNARMSHKGVVFFTPMSWSKFWPST